MQLNVLTSDATVSWIQEPMHWSSRKGQVCKVLKLSARYPVARWSGMVVQVVACDGEEYHAVAIEGATALLLSRDAACNLERCIDSMWMLTTALFGSRLQGHECKRKTAEWSSEHASVLLSLSSLTSTAHSLFLHIDNTGYEPSR